jgi:hypothetical protein
MVISFKITGPFDLGLLSIEVVIEIPKRPMTFLGATPHKVR